MCGIVGYAGLEQAAPILLNGLEKLEYRGYDSAGIAIGREDGIEIVKAKGRLNVLREMTDDGKTISGTWGIGHTRWATHGEPSTNNSHPHYSRGKRVVVVHNGIIENHQELKDRLIKKGYRFQTQTDTEVAAQLLDFYYKGDPLDAIQQALIRVTGSYALGILFQDFPGVIYAVRKDCPLIVGAASHGNFIASDVPAILNHTRTVYEIQNMEIVKMTDHDLHFYNLDGEEIEKQANHIDWDAEAAEKSGYEHFMMKEIHEQPKAVRDTISARIHENRLDLSQIGLSGEQMKSFRRIYIVACGSAYHVGVAARYVMEDLARVPVEVDLASEFRYRNPVLEEQSLCIVISQSGETADSLAALREAKTRGIPVLAVVNVLGSSIAREADYVMYTWAGPEISVATTKAYSTQLAALYMFSMELAREKEQISMETYEALVAELLLLPDKIERILADKERIQWFAHKFASSHDIFFIGRGIDYAISLEGSLKLKEITYIHSEAYAAGELKHGTISLVEEGTLVIGVVTQPQLYEKTISNMLEVKSRGAYLMGVTNYGNYNMEDIANFTVYVPKTDPHFTTSLAVIPLQLMAYYVSVAKGLDVDKPRNLAKSVTVE